MHIDAIDVSKALIAPLLQGRVTLNAGMRILIVNSVYSLEVHDLANNYECDFVQYFRPYADGLSQVNEHVYKCIDDVRGEYDAIFIQMPKNKIESQFLLANSIELLSVEGVLICCAHNKAGGTRLTKMLKEFGGQDVDNLSMNKCRSAWAVGFDNSGQVIRDGALVAGGRQAVCDGDYLSQAGIYGWDKIDAGSKILLAHAPEKISSRRVADFGCGYGFLSRYLIQHLSAPYKLYAIDADARAVSLCLENIAAPEGGMIEPLWSDIVSGSDLPKNLDLIFMNPPFHEGKKSDATIGQAFIMRAAQSLRAKGVLYMVANVHLPYERDLSKHFAKVEKLHEGQGFKVFKAVK